MLVAGALVGVLVPAYFLLLAEVSHIGWDFQAYHAAAEAVLDGERFVGLEPGPPGVSYVYPPVTVALFIPGAVLGGWQVGLALGATVGALAAVGLGLLAVRVAERDRGPLSRRDRVAVVAFCAGCAPVVAALGLGQVDTLMALLVAGSFLALEDDRPVLAGACLAVAALFKLFPAVLGLWLVRRRAWRAVASAVATGLGAIAAGVAWLGVGPWARYVAVLADRSRVADFAGTVSPDFFAMTLSRPLSALVPGLDPAWYVPLSVLVVAPLVALAARREDTLEDRLVTFLAAVVAAVVVSPASNVLYVVYALVPAVALCCRVRPGPGRLPLLAGTALLALPVQPGHVEVALATLGAPAPLGASLLGVLRPAATVASPPLVGLLVVLAWAARHGLATPQRRTASGYGVGGD